MRDYLTFQKMITPVFIQVIFWIVIAAVVIAGLAQLADQPLAGLAILIFGPLGIRIYAEILIVIFRMNDTLLHIRRNTEPSVAAPQITSPTTTG